MLESWLFMPLRALVYFLNHHVIDYREKCSKGSIFTIQRSSSSIDPSTLAVWCSLDHFSLYSHNKCLLIHSLWIESFPRYPKCIFLITVQKEWPKQEKFREKEKVAASEKVPNNCKFHHWAKKIPSIILAQKFNLSPLLFFNPFQQLICQIPMFRGLFGCKEVDGK